MVIRGIGGPEPIKPSKNSVKGDRINSDVKNEIVKDEVSISDSAKQILQRKQAEEVALNVIKNTPDIRPSAVERGKRFIESGEYKSDKAMDFVAKKIGEEMVVSLIVKKENEE